MSSDDILRDLYYGRIAPWEHQSYTEEANKELSASLSELAEKLNNTADTETKGILEKYLAVRAQLEDAELLSTFKSGYRLGIKLKDYSVYFKKAS